MSTFTIKSFALAAAAVATLAGTSSAEAQNLLTNPGFESPDASGGDQGGATGYGSFGGAFVTTTSPRTDLQAGKAFGVGGFFQDVPAVEGDSFVASVYALNPAADALAADQVAAVNIEFQNASGQIAFVTQRIINGGTPFDQYVFGSVTGTAPAGTTFARFVAITGAFDDVNGDGAVVGGGSVRFDDASFSRVTAVVPEPTGLAALALAGGALVRRRRR